MTVIDKNNLNYKFEKYTSKVKKLDAKSISDIDKLYLYSHYKQALFGNNNNEKPSLLDRVSMEKWKAWNNLKDLSTESAMKNYISKVKDLYKNLKQEL